MILSEQRIEQRAQPAGIQNQHGIPLPGSHPSAVAGINRSDYGGIVTAASHNLLLRIFIKGAQA